MQVCESVPITSSPGSASPRLSVVTDGFAARRLAVACDFAEQAHAVTSREIALHADELTRLLDQAERACSRASRSPRT